MQNCSSVDGPVLSRSRPTRANSRDSPALCASPQPKSSEYPVNLFFLSILFPAPGGPRKPAPPAKRESTAPAPALIVALHLSRSEPFQDALFHQQTPACPGMLIFNCFNSFYEYN